MKLFFTCFSLLFCQITFGQITDSLTLILGGEVNLTEGFNAIGCSEGGYLIFATKSFQNPENYNDPWMIKVDEEGSVEWEFLTDYAGDGLFDLAFRGIEVSDGYIVLGSFSDPSTFSDYNSLTKIDFDGNLVWSKVVDNHPITSYGGIVALDNDEFAIGGYRLPETGNYEFSVARFDALGTELWNKGYPELGATQGLFFFSDLVQALDGGFVLGGQIGTTSHILKTDSTGELLWNTDLETQGGTVSVNVFEDGTIAALTTLSHTSNPSVDYLIHLDDMGSILNVNQFDFSLVEATSDAVVDAEGNVYIVGNDYENDHGLLIKTNQNGDTLWTKTYTAPDSLAGIYFQGIELTSEGQLIATGGGLLDFSPTLKVVAYAYFTVLTLEGETVSTFAKPLQSDEPIFDVFPNPAPTVANFTTNLADSKKWTVQLFDLTGKLILEENGKGNSFTLHRNNLTSGTYVYRVFSEDNALMDIGKLIFK